MGFFISFDGIAWHGIPIGTSSKKAYVSYHFRTKGKEMNEEHGDLKNKMSDTYGMPFSNEFQLILSSSPAPKSHQQVSKSSAKEASIQGNESDH